MGLQVNTLTGNLFLPRHDLFVPGRGFNLKISFYYNSFLFQENSGFGNGWNFLFNIRYRTETSGSKTIIRGDGREELYIPLGNGAFKSPTGFFTTLTAYQANKFSLKELDGTTFYFDNPSHQRITKMEEPNGNSINFQYSDTLLTALTTSAGQTISLNYTDGRLSSIIDAVATPSRTYTYNYDVAGNLTSVKDPMNGKTEYTYLVNGPMKTVKDKNGSVVNIVYYNDFSAREIIGCNKRISLSYDTTTLTTYVTDHLSTGDNQVTKYQYQEHDGHHWLAKISGNCCGFNMSFAFDAQGNRTQETDASGNSYKYTYDSRGNVLTITNPLNQTITYTYTTDFNKVASVTDYKGNLYTFTYDNKGNLTKVTEPGNQAYSITYTAQGDILSATDANGKVYNFTHDAAGNPASVTAPNGFYSAWQYDARGNLLSFTDARGNTETGEYDLLNRLTRIIDPLNRLVEFTYDAEGNVTTVGNKNGEKSQLHYDASNRIVRFIDRMNNSHHYGYDGMDNLVSWKNPLGNEWKIGYDSRNRPVSIQEPLNRNHTVSYDANGNVSSATLANGKTVTYSYDAKNRLTGIDDNTGKVATFTYDANDNVTGFSFGDGVSSTAQHDNRNRITKLTNTLGNGITYVYDGNGNLTSVTDRNGFVRSYTYDGLNRIKSFTNNNGHTINVVYDSQGNITEVKDQNNQSTTYSYDALNRTTSVTYPDGRFVQLGYNSKGNIISKKLPDGATITYQYDSLNRPISRTLPDGNVISYSYDALGRIVTATNNAGTIQIAYDALNRITSESFDGRTVRYVYNSTGRTHTTIYPDSTLIIKTYDTRNRLVGISKGNVTLAAYTYNNQNRVTSKTFGNQVQTQLYYDFANQLTSLSTSNGTIQNSVFAYDKLRNKTSINRLNDLSASEQFSYDNAYRLTSYKRGIINGAITIHNSYTYDAVGNRTAANLNGTATSYTRNNLNQVTGLNNGTQSSSFTYDNNGNLTFDGTYHKKYDAESRLLKDSASPANVIAYQYDALGRRVVKTVNGNPLKYTYAGLAQIEERNLANTVLKRTVFKHMLSPVMMEANENRYYYHQNEMNSVEAITGSQGNVVERYQYDAYGKPTVYNASNSVVNNSVIGNHFGFTGQEYDFTTGTYKFHFRNYSPVLGTFLQRDLIGYADGMGMYQYVGNNPANGVDILGLEDCKPKEKLSFEAIATEQPLVVGWTQVILDEAGNTGFVLSLFDLPRGLAENAYRTQYLKAAANYATMGEAAFATQSLANAGSKFSQAFQSGQKFSGILKVSNAVGKAGPALGFIDLGVKAANYDRVMNDPAASSADIMDAQADIAGSGGNLVGGLATMGAAATGSTIALPAAVVMGTFALTDAGVTFVTGKNLRQHAEKPVTDVYNYFTSDDDYKTWLKTFGLEDEDSEFLKNIFKQGKGETYLRTKRGYGPKPKCPDGGTQRPNPIGPGQTGTTEVISALDPNEIIGPEGYGQSKWVAAKDRLPYTITYENDKSATAPAKFVRITAPIQPKMDASTFELGSFGFNNLTFSIPAGTSSYYNRVDARDSLGLYIDVTAGYDQFNNVAFWELQSIDPTTLLPPTDPLKGFLLLQDSVKKESGHGFVNFSIKPVTAALTGDTISAMASIVFDQNAAIETNRHKNTVDAFAPTSSITGLPTLTPNTEVPLQLSGTDDTNGSGIRSFAIYISDNDGPLQLYVANFSRSDTTFKGVAEHQYKFYVAATDNVGNTEEVKLVGTVRISDGEEVICPNGNTSLESSVTGSTYQWQVDNGTGFVNLSDGGVYSGTTTATLTLTGAPTSFYGYQYRCLVNGTTYSNLFVIKFAMTWEGGVDNAWENVANWSCHSLPDMNTDVIILGAKERYPQVSSNVFVRTLRTAGGASVRVKSGFNLTVVK